MPKLKIDGPAGRQEVSNKYRENYDAIFKTNKKSTKGRRKNNGKS